MKKLLSFLMFLMVLVMTVPAFAADAAVAWWVPVADRGLQAVGSVLGMVLIALALKVFQKMGISVSTDQQYLYNDAISRAIGSAEEWAHQQLLKTKTAPSSDDKLAQAVKFATTVIDEYGLEKKGEDWVKARVHALLGLDRKIVSDLPSVHPTA